MESVRVTRTSYYSYEGTLKSPNITHSNLSLKDFVTAAMDRELDLAIRGYGVIPPLHIMNDVFARGQSGKSYSWVPFRISESQYERLAGALVEHAHDGFVIVDESLWSNQDFKQWFAALRAKIKANPTFKQLSFSVQHEILGIPLGEGQWIPRNLDLKNRKSKKIDGVLSPLGSFFRALEHCTPYCCRLEAFNFDADNVLAQADELGRSEIMRLLDTAIIDIEQIDADVEVFKSELLNSKLMRQELEQLLQHFATVISRRQACS